MSLVHFKFQAVYAYIKLHSNVFGSATLDIVQFKNDDAGNDKGELNILLNQYPDFFSRMMMLENLRNKTVNDSTRRKEKAYEKHLQRLRNHLLESSQK